MKGSIIIIRNNEQVVTADYADYKDIQKAVGDLAEHFLTMDFDSEKGETFQIIGFCNEEYLLIDSEETNIVNAGAFLLNEQIVYGNIAFLIDKGNGEERGFTKAEEKKFVNTVTALIKSNAGVVSMVHNRYDGNKPDPRVTFISF
ncbi:MAG: hypothetical protein K2J39_11470 [Ruminococcus sp.]|nr:hypothetical protein [Ruminococcus sp.]